MWPWSRTCTKLFLVPWASICHGVQLGTKWSKLYSAQDGWLDNNCVKVHQTASTYRVSDTQKCNLYRNSLVILVFLTWRYHGHKKYASLGVRIREGSRNFGPQWPATVWKACQHNSKFEEAKVDQLFKEHQLRDLHAAPKEVKAKINHIRPGVWKPTASSTW